MFTEIFTATVSVFAGAALLLSLFAHSFLVRFVARYVFVVLAVIVLLTVLVVLVPGEDAFTKRLLILAAVGAGVAVCFVIRFAVRRSPLYQGLCHLTRRVGVTEELDADAERKDRLDRLRWHHDLPGQSV